MIFLNVKQMLQGFAIFDVNKNKNVTFLVKSELL